MNTATHHYTKAGTFCSQKAKHNFLFNDQFYLQLAHLKNETVIRKRANAEGSNGNRQVLSDELQFLLDIAG